MREFIGIMLILVGVAIAAYIVLWVMLVGGVVQIVDATRMDPVDSGGIALRALRAFFCEIGGLGALPFMFVGIGILEGGKK